MPNKKLLFVLFVFLPCLVFSQTPGLVWNKAIGGSRGEALHPFPIQTFGVNPAEVVKTHDGLGFLLITNSQSNDGDVVGHHGNDSSDIWIVKMDFSGNILWQKSLGGNSDDFFNKFIYHPDGSLTLFGETESNDGDVSGYHGGRDMWVVKINSSGNFLWQKTLGGSLMDDFRAADLLPDGSFILTGYTFSNDGDVSGNHGAEDIWVVKLSATGDLQWQKCFGGTNTEKPFDIKVMSDGNFIMTGSSVSNNFDAIGNHGGSDLWVIKIGTTGNLIWQRLYGGTSDEIGNKILISNSGSLIVLGMAQSLNGDVVGNHGTGRDTWVLNIDYSTNAIIWQKCIGGTGTENPKDIINRSDGNFLVMSESLSNDGDAVGSHGATDVLVAHLNSTGSIVWSKCYGGILIENYYAGSLNTTDNSCVLAGISTSIDVPGYHVPSVNAPFDDGWAFKIDANGNLQWQRCVGGFLTDYFFSIQDIGNDEYIFGGRTNSEDGDLEGFPLGPNVLLTRLGRVNRIKGIEYLDINRNGIKESGEPFADWPVRANKPGYVRETVPVNNEFLLEVDSGTLITKLVPQSPYYDIVPLTHTSVFSGYYAQDSFSFALQPQTGKRDLTISVAGLTPARPGFDVTYRIFYRNIGTDTVSAGTVFFKRDARMNFISSVPSPSSTNGDTLKWDYTNLHPFDTAATYIIVNMHVQSPPVVNVNDTLSSLAIIDPVAGDLTPADDTVIYKQVVIGSFDPNDKSENKGGTITKQEVTAGQYIYYLIRFQNTGTDTAFGIYIRDTLDVKLDWPSFNPVAASHNYEYRVFNENRIKFSFPNIKLVDSLHNEPLSHGFVLFRVRPKTNLSIGDTIKNSASIYFDNNLPVKTNTQNTIVVNNIITGIGGPRPDLFSLSLFPNPTGETIWLRLKDRTNGNAVLTVIDMNGREVHRRNLGNINTTDYTTSLDLARYPTGMYTILLSVGKKLYSQKLVLQ